MFPMKKKIIFLHNRLNKEDALKRIAQEAFRRKTVSFYRYVRIEAPEKLRDQLFRQWSELGVLGRVYLAREGINAQISVPEPNWQIFEEKLNAVSEFSSVPFKMAVEEGLSFWKLKIKVRTQIVADGLRDDDYDVTDVGRHLTPQEFQTALEKEDAIIVDMRNHYESRIGKFERAITPDADTFREELPMVREVLKGKEDKKILLYCTGGIRCEKASAFLRHHGFEDVNQLYGGIIHYVHEMRQKKLPSRFIGKNFVFDERLGERITDDVLSSCDQCGQPCDAYTNCANMICNRLFIQCEVCRKKNAHCCSSACKNIASLPEDAQRTRRKGIKHTFSRYKAQIRPGLQIPSGTISYRP